ncbi:MAG TPA: hypothetical protein VKT27_04135 [Candidatus Binataceae bacterium]|nr:hypothetical protein [Candidatus Binataceae bacterium]
MRELWYQLQLPDSLHEAWGRFPPPMRGLMMLLFALIFAMLFVRDHNRGGRRYIVYGPITLGLFVYAAMTFGLI